MSGLTTTITPIDYFQFGRVGRVELWEKGQVKDGINLDGLDFKFTTGKMFESDADAKPAVATVSILGLSRSSVNYLCKFCDEAAYLDRGISCRVLAGYAEDGKDEDEMELFHFPVASAMPSMPPDNWVTLNLRYQANCELLKSYSYVKSLVRNEKTGKFDDPWTLRQVMEDIKDEFGIQWVYHEGCEVLDEEKVSVFAFNGGIRDAVAALKKRYKFIDIVQSQAVDKKTGLPTIYDVYTSGLYVKVGDRWSWKEQPTAGNSWIVDKNHGMIGMPMPNHAPVGSRRVIVRTLINASYRPEDIVLLTSDICPDCNGQYRIMTVSHSGHLRGAEWYSTIELKEAV